MVESIIIADFNNNSFSSLNSSRAPRFAECKKLVRILTNLKLGINSIPFKFKQNYPAGAYILTIETKEYSDSAKLILEK